MKPISLMRMLVLALLLTLCVPVAAQSPVSFDGSFETAFAPTGLPPDWQNWGRKFDLTVDSTVSHKGSRSLRVAPAEGRTSSDWGCVVVSLPLTAAGKKVTLTGYLKLEDVKDGFVGLYMRVNTKSGAAYRWEDMHTRNLAGTASWKKYSITLPIPSDGGTVCVGVMNYSAGILWADDLEVELDGRALGKAPPREVFKADSDHEFDKGAGISIGSLTPQKSADLEVLGKIWGFLKYYHPAVRAGEYNWDYELFRILPAVLNSKDASARNEVLQHWISKLPVSGNSPTTRIDSAKVKFYPDLDWLSDEKTLGHTLSVTLKNVAAMKRSNTCYYVETQAAGNPQFLNERSYDDMTYPDAGFRLLTLYRYWNIIQYFFPYKHLITEGWNNKLAEYIPKVVDARDTADWETALLGLICSIHDSHAYLYRPTMVIRNVNRFNTLPLRVQFTEEKALLTGVGENGGGLQKGDVITAINNEPMAAIIRRHLPLTSASNYATQLNRMARFLFQTKDSVMELEYERDGKISTVTLATMSAKDAIVKDSSPIISWKKIGEDVGYVYPGNFKNSQMNEMIAGFKGTKGMIIDLRCYPADNLMMSLMPYVLPVSTSFAKFTEGSITEPGLFTWTGNSSVGRKNNMYYKGKVVILVNASTQSNAEFVTMGLRLAPDAVVLGSTTAGADGNVTFFTLPGALQTDLSGIGVYYPDGRETQRIGIVPDIVMEPTVKGLRENRDELLEKALSMIRQ